MEWILYGGAGLLLYLLGRAHEHGDGKTKVIEDEGVFRGQNWKIYVTSTDDASIYKGVYEQDDRVEYEVTGRGVTNTLNNLADEVERV